MRGGEASGEFCAPPRRIFHGWWVIASVFLTQALGVGFTTYAFGLFQKPLAEAFGVSRSTLSLGLTAHMIFIALVGPFLGRLLDRGDSRRVMSWGAICAVLSLSAMVFARELWQLGLLFALGLGAGVAAIGPLPSAKLATNWFRRLRGRALGISSVGTSLGGMLVPPLLAGALAYGGWRYALGVAAVVMALLALPVILLCVRDRPEDLGLHPDGDALPPPPSPASLAPAWTLRRAIADRNFWVITGVLGCFFAGLIGVIASFVPYASDLGLEADRAALTLSLISFAGIGGKLIFGSLADHLDKRMLLWVALLLFTGALLIMQSSPSFTALLVGSCAMGLSTGGAMPLWAALIGDCYGREAFGGMMGFMTPLMLPLNIAALQLMPWAYDSTGGYEFALRIFMGALVLASLALLWLRVPQQPQA